MLIYLGSYYLLLGTFFLFLPLIFIEFGRPRDLMKSGFYLIIGVILITKYNLHDSFLNVLLICLSLLVSFHVFEIFSFRFNLLTSQEKNKLRNFVEIKKNLSKFLMAFSLVFQNLSKIRNLLKFDMYKKSFNKKKWVSNGNVDNILSSNKRIN